MDMFCGDMGTNLWNRKKWEKNFNDNMVIVCTAEVLRQCLHHSFISMERINLLIFDEAHHAKKDHPYARIIKDFYAQAAPNTQLPKIFGMTASPVDARVDPKKAAAELETILHCQIATAADPSLMQFTSNSKQEQLARYPRLLPKFETPLFKEMHAHFKSNSILHKPLLFAKDSTRELGAWCSDQMWAFCLSEDEVKKLQAKTERKYLEKKVHAPMSILEQQRLQLREAQEIVKAHVFELPDYKPNSTFVSSNLSSKVVLLIKYLRDRFERPTEDKCIVFVKQRYTARLLATLFSQPNIKTPHLFVGTLVSIFLFQTISTEHRV
jgi:endoribonuclease Dicer